MTFKEFVISGGVQFMVPLTIFALILIVLIIRTGWLTFKEADSATIDKNISIIQHLSTFSLVWGILGQLIGLFQAFEVIQELGNVSMALLAGGLKVSMHTTLYGLGIFLTSRFAIILLHTDVIKRVKIR